MAKGKAGKGNKRPGTNTALAADNNMNGLKGETCGRGKNGNYGARAEKQKNHPKGIC